MMKKYYFLLILLLQVTLLYSQHQNDNWYFGVGMGLNFDGSNPTPLTNGSTNNLTKKTASISDENGNLLFYTDGTNIWNRQHQIMQNSSHILSGEFANPLIIPFPLNPYKYYIFFNRLIDNYVSAPIYYSDSITYSIISFENNYDGEVITNDIVLTDGYEFESNVFNLKPITYVSTIHNDGISYWIIVFPGSSTSSHLIKAFKLDENGFSEPFITNLNQIQSTYTSLVDIVINKNGNKIALATQYHTLCCFDSTIEILNFNNSTGEITRDNSFWLNSENMYLGIEFSPNSNFLYILHKNGIRNYTFDQYNLSNSQRTNLGTFSLTDTYVYDANFRRAKDDKIYIPSKFIFNPSDPDHSGDSRKLSVINNPNTPGFACNLVPNQIDFSVYGNNFQTYKIPTLVPMHPTINTDCISNLYINYIITDNHLFQVANNITCNNIINDNLHVTFKAGNIVLENGFYVSSYESGIFIAEIDPCNIYNPMKSSKNSLNNITSSKVKNQIKIFPNPNNGKFTVLKPYDFEILSIDIISLSDSQNVKNYTYENYESEIIFDTNFSKKGLYVLNILTSKGEHFSNIISIE